MPPDKSLFASKTFWANIIGPVAMLLGIFNIDLTPEDQQVLIGAAVALQAAINVVLRMVTRTGVRVRKEGTLQASPFAGLLALILVGTFLGGCSEVGFQGETPREKDLEVLSRFDAVQAGVLAVLKNDHVPIAVKREIRSVEQSARAAVLAYDDAVRAGGGNTDALLSAAGAAVVRLIETVQARTGKRLSWRWWPPDGDTHHLNALNAGARARMA